MIRFDVKRRSVIFEYEPEFTSAEWILNELRTHHEVTLSRGFTFKDDDLIDGPGDLAEDEIGEPAFRFRFAKRRSGYFRIPGRSRHLSVHQ